MLKLSFNSLMGEMLKGSGWKWNQRADRCPFCFPTERLENLSIHVWESLGSPMENVHQRALAGVAQWIALPPVYVANSIPSRAWGCGLDPQ